jgi:hypothetical protein
MLLANSAATAALIPGGRLVKGDDSPNVRTADPQHR